MRFESSFQILLVTCATFNFIHFSKLHTLQCLHPGVSVTAVTTNCTDEILDWRCPYRGTNPMEQQAPDELRTHRVLGGVVSEWHTRLYKVQRTDGRQQVAPKLLYVFNRQHGDTSDTTIIFHSSFYFHHQNTSLMNKIPTRCSKSSLFFFVHFSTCFGRYIHPSSGALNVQAGMM
jgi:hypothetical protein